MCRVHWWENQVDFAYRQPQLDFIHDQVIFDEFESLKGVKIGEIL
jgi:hypothetical protein